MLWDPYTKKDIEKLERIQRKAVRFIFGKYRRLDSPSLLMQQHKIPTLAIRRKINRLLLLHKFLSSKVPFKLPDCIQKATTRRTRHTTQYTLAPIFAKTNSYQNSFFPKTVNEWNKLPPSIFESNNFLSELESLFFSQVKAP